MSLATTNTMGGTVPERKGKTKRGEVIARAYMIPSTRNTRCKMLATQVVAVAELIEKTARSSRACELSETGENQAKQKNSAYDKNRADNNHSGSQALGGGRNMRSRFLESKHLEKI